VLPDGVDDAVYADIRDKMRLSVLRIWRSDRVIAGVDVWSIVDEAWSSMAEDGFRSSGPFLPYALRVAQNKAIDAIKRAEARRRVLSLEESLGTDGAQALVLADTIPGSQGAEADYLDEQEHLDTIERLSLAQRAINELLSERERDVFVAVQVNRKSCAAVGRELDPPLTGQRVGQIVASALVKVRDYIDHYGRSDD
jgi:RNA polymerase sigma factor (sigma-70 family)